MIKNTKPFYIGLIMVILVLTSLTIGFINDFDGTRHYDHLSFQYVLSKIVVLSTGVCLLSHGLASNNSFGRAGKKLWSVLTNAKTSI